MKRFLLLGDSITEQSLDFDNGGWALRLLSSYRRKADIIPRGFSGYNTRWILKYLKEQQQSKIDNKSSSASSSSNVGIDTSNLDLAVIFLGANDAAEEECYQHVPLDEYKENLKQLCILVNAPRVILITPPPYSAVKYMETMGFPRSTRTDERTMQYAQAVVDVAKFFEEYKNKNKTDSDTVVHNLDFSVACANVNKTFREKLPDNAWVDAMSDGLHLGPVANKIVAETLVEVIAESFTEISSTNLIMLLPSHRVFDPTNSQNYVPVTKEEEEIMKSHSMTK